MSDSPLMNKMDALLKKHRGDGDAAPGSSAHAEHALPATRTAPPDAWLPVLTQIIERGTPPAVPEAVHPAAPDSAPEPAVVEPPAPAASPSVPPSPESRVPAPAIEPDAVNDALAEQLMSELAPRLSEIMEQQVAAELRRNLDQTVAALLSQLDVNVREIVRDAITEKLRLPRDPSA